jgi:hypothetical protein
MQMAFIFRHSKWAEESRLLGKGCGPAGFLWLLWYACSRQLVVTELGTYETRGTTRAGGGALHQRELGRQSADQPPLMIPQNSDSRNKDWCTPTIISYYGRNYQSRNQSPCKLGIISPKWSEFEEALHPRILRSHNALGFSSTEKPVPKCSTSGRRCLSGEDAPLCAWCTCAHVWFRKRWPFLTWSTDG